MRELELDEPAGLIYVPARSLGHLPTWADRRRVFERVVRVAPARRALRLELLRLRPEDRGGASTASGSSKTASGTGSTTRSTTTGVDITLESGDAISLWWLNRSEWEGLIEIGRLRGRGALRRLRPPAVRRERDRVRLGCPQARITRSRGSTTRGARASPRTSSSTSRRRARPAAPSSSSPAAPAGSPCPIAKAGIRVIGVDASAGMLEVAREYAAAEGVGASTSGSATCASRPVTERVPLVLIPFRSLLHMTTEDERLRALRAARELLAPGGRLVFDVFAPERRGRRGHARPLARARAWDLRARRLGRERANADALGPAGRRGVDHASRLALAARVAAAARPRRLRRRGAVGLVRPPAVRAAARTWSSRRSARDA